MDHTEMKIKMICPMSGEIKQIVNGSSKNNCILSQCAWYNNTYKKCAILLIAENNNKEITHE
jgi:hypothetical protein